MTTSVATNTAIAMVDAAADLADVGSTDANGAMVFYSGTPPADAQTALSGNTVLGTIEFANPAYGAGADAAPGGIATLLSVPIIDVDGIDATATNTFARSFDRDNNVIAQFIEGTDYTTNAAAFVTGAELELTTHSLTQPET